MLNKALRYIPPIIWMALIFNVSSNSNLPGPDTRVLDFIMKKTAHVLEYAFLNVLWVRALGTKHIRTAFLLSLAFAFTDETHQLFTPNRSGRLRDVGIDAIGLTISTYIMYKEKIWKKHISPRLLRTLKSLA